MIWPFRKTAPSIASVGRALAQHRHDSNAKKARARRIELHNAMATQLGREPIQWRDA